MNDIAILLMLCVVGMPGCGKNIFIHEAREYNFPIVSMGDAVRAETEKRGLPPVHHGEVAAALREEKGLAAVAYLVIDKVTPDCIIDGIRGAAEIDFFKNHYTVDVLAIYTSPRTRFERLKKRKRAGDPQTWEEFQERDLRELTFGIGNVIALADFILINESTKEQFEKECRAFLTHIYKRRVL